MFGASWCTSMAGLFAGLTIILGQVSAVVDSDPTTNMDVSIIVATIAAMIAAFSARDDKVTSRQAGAER